MESKQGLNRAYILRILRWIIWTNTTSSSSSTAHWPWWQCLPRPPDPRTLHQGLSARRVTYTHSQVSVVLRGRDPLGTRSCFCEQFVLLPTSLYVLQVLRWRACPSRIKETWTWLWTDFRKSKLNLHLCTVWTRPFVQVHFTTGWTSSGQKYRLHHVDFWKVCLDWNTNSFFGLSLLLYLFYYSTLKSMPQGYSEIQKSWFKDEQCCSPRESRVHVCGHPTLLLLDRNPPVSWPFRCMSPLRSVVCK